MTARMSGRSDQGQGEFDLIARHFRPLAGPSALGLADDAALLPPPPHGEHLVVTCDTMVAGVHFLADADPDAIAHKLLAVNLSDLAAMGAVPSHYLLAASWPAPPSDAWMNAFTAGLRRIQDSYGLELAGGDTTRTDGPLTLTVTAMGHVAADQALRRTTARPGDLVYVSGSIGDAALGLMLQADGVSSSSAVDDPRFADLFERLNRPTPRLALGRALRGVATAAMDVSDGLVADLGHIARGSSCGAVIRAPAVPLSAAASALLAQDPDLMHRVLGGGDDYELLFTVSPDRRAAPAEAAARSGTPVVEIGHIRAEPGVTVVDRDDQPINVASSGYRHF